MSDVVLLNGEPAPEADTSAGRLLGLTCFDTMAFDQGRILQRGRHLERLARGIDQLGLEPAGGMEAVEAAIEKALSATDHGSGIVRASVHATGHPTGLHLEDPSADVLVQVTAPRYGDVSEGVSVVTTTVRAPAASAWPVNLKGSCLPRWLAHREARGRDAFEGLMLDRRDHVVSGTRSNVFMVLDARLYTPPTPPAFPGITRDRVLDAAREADHPPGVRPVHRDLLDEVDEAFITFTGPGIVPVVELDGEVVGTGEPGPITEELTERITP